MLRIVSIAMSSSIWLMERGDRSFDRQSRRREVPLVAARSLATNHFHSRGSLNTQAPHFAINGGSADAELPGVAVVDAGGHMLAFARQDGALIGCIDLATNKARTARLFDKRTEDLNRLAQPGADLYRIELSNAGDVVVIGGGVPVVQDGVVIGAVGASAGTVAQDIAIAEAALAAMLSGPS